MYFLWNNKFLYSNGRMESAAGTSQECNQKTDERILADLIL